MATAIRKWNYGHYKSDNYGGHSMAIRVGKLTLYFSYDTIVGFHELGQPEKICENVWTTTTGKHLNWLEPDKSRRLPSEQFNAELEQVLEAHSLSV